MMSSCTSIRASFYATAPAETAHKTHHYIEIIGQKRAVNLLVAHGKVRIHGDAIEAGGGGPAGGELSGTGLSGVGWTLSGDPSSRGTRAMLAASATGRITVIRATASCR